MSKLVLDDISVPASSFIAHVTTSNIYCVLRISKIFCQKTLQNNVTSLINHSFVSLSKANEFKLIDFNILRFIVSRSDLNITSEVEVFTAIVDWVEYDKNTRISFMVDLLKQVRLPILSSEIIKDVIKTHSLCTDQNCIDYIDSVLVQKSKELSLDSFQNENRCCVHESMAFMFYDFSKKDRYGVFSYRNPERKIRLFKKQKVGLNSSQQKYQCKLYNFTIPNIT